MKKYYQTEDYKIIKIQDGEGWYTISTNRSTCFGLKKKWGKVPKVGDTVTLFTRGFSEIVGMDLNGERCFLFTEEELEQQRQEWLKENEEKKQKEFLENKDKLDEKYNNLPHCFQRRIQKFRYNNPRFRIDYEPYEMFCCEQAVLIANACKTIDGVNEFYKMKWEDQKKQVPELSDGHSGNTFGVSCKLAALYLDSPDNVVKQHGSLSVLVGSDEYGDVEKA